MSNECHSYGSRSGLQRAFLNIEKYYPLVAVLEYFQESLFLAEKLIPEYFDGASRSGLGTKF